MQTDAVVTGVPFAAFAMVIWIACIMLAVGLGLILAYLWYRYAMNKAAATLAVTVYAIVCTIFILALFAAGISLPL